MPGINGYQFGFNNPISFNDPLGDEPQQLKDQGNTTVSNSFAGGEWFGITGRIGPVSGNHWSDQYRSVERNLALMNLQLRF
ncbi:MAG: hypothetical protein ACFB2Y_10670 [Fulvivirga sp.]